MWNYLYFLILIKIKDKTEFTGPESFVYDCIQRRNLEWFPRMRAISLDTSGKEEEENELCFLRKSLELSNNSVTNLGKQVEDLKDLIMSKWKKEDQMSFRGTSSHSK